MKLTVVFRIIVILSIAVNLLSFFLRALNSVGLGILPFLLERQADKNLPRPHPPSSVGGLLPNSYPC